MKRRFTTIALLICMLISQIAIGQIRRPKTSDDDTYTIANMSINSSENARKTVFKYNEKNNGISLANPKSIYTEKDYSDYFSNNKPKTIKKTDLNSSQSVNIKPVRLGDTTESGQIITSQDKTNLATEEIVTQQDTTNTKISNVLDLVPANARFCLRLNKLDSSLSLLDQYTKGMIPLPMGITMLARGQLAQILGDPLLSGLNTNGDIVSFQIEQGLTSPSVILVPITDYDAFLNKNPKIVKNDNNSFTFPVPEAQMDLLGFKISDSYMALTDGLDESQITDLKNGKGGFLNNITESDINLSNQTGLWIYINAAKAMETFGPMLSGAMTGMPGMEAQGQQIEMAQKALSDIDTFSIKLTPAAQDLRLDIAIVAKPGSELASQLDPATIQMQLGILMMMFADPANPDGGKANAQTFFGDTVKADVIGTIDLVRLAMMQMQTQTGQEMPEIPKSEGFLAYALQIKDGTVYIKLGLTKSHLQSMMKIAQPMMMGGMAPM